MVGVVFSGTRGIERNTSSYFSSIYSSSSRSNLSRSIFSNLPLTSSMLIRFSDSLWSMSLIKHLVSPLGNFERTSSEGNLSSQQGRTFAFERDYPRISSMKRMPSPQISASIPKPSSLNTSGAVYWSTNFSWLNCRIYRKHLYFSL